jgi:Resolvase, N terminal domain
MTTVADPGTVLICGNHFDGRSDALSGPVVVIGIDRLGRNAADVMATIRELGERGIVLRWPSGCMPAVNPQAPSRRHSMSAVRLSIACWPSRVT